MQFLSRAVSQLFINRTITTFWMHIYSYIYTDCFDSLVLSGEIEYRKVYIYLLSHLISSSWVVMFDLSWDQLSVVAIQ